MPTIYDNKNRPLLLGLKDALERSSKSDISTAYFNLRGWKKLASLIEKYRPEQGEQCRLLLGMYGQENHFRKEILEEEEQMREIDRDKATKLKSKAVRDLRKQLMLGIPTNEDEAALRRLAQQLKDKKVVVKCFTRHPLHAKLYLTFNNTDFAGKIGFLGSSNLTLAGLEKQGELNIDVLDQQSCETLSNWFEEKWNDKFSLDISQEIIRIIEASWAGEFPYSPYHIYIKMAYHLSEDARRGLTDFYLPKELKDILFDFQARAVRIATHYVSRKGGVLIGDVVGLGKTFIAIAVAKILEEEHGWQTLILCPKNLENMWNDYISHPIWGIRGRVVPTSQVQNKLPNLSRHHIVILDESHNLRNPQGKRYKIIKDYITQNDSKCILLSATPYNKTYLDLSAQLGLFIDKDADLGVRPSKFLNETEGIFEGLDSSLKAFEKSVHPEDWQQLMSRFLVRRTRTFIKENYGHKDENGRYYITLTNGEKRFFPDRVAKTVKYKIDDQYKRLFSEEVVDMINGLELSRYDLNKYKKKNLKELSKEEKDILKDLERSHAHPKGFCRINLFKRLESSGFAFLKSIQRHILRNCIFIYAIESNNKLMIKEKNSDIIADAFEEQEGGITGFDEDIEEETYFLMEFNAYYQMAEKTYRRYRSKRNIRWIPSSYFNKHLLSDLRKDTENLIGLLRQSKEWNPKRDLKIKKLEELLKKDYIKKAIVFSQSKETAEYLKDELFKRKIKNIALATGGMDNIQDIIKCFSPKSNQQSASQIEEIDVLIATDILSEGQNLQDCNTVINYDLPWAIIKLIQRVGRVDRIGQEAEKIYCHSFMPNDGLENLIRLKSRIQNRLRENAEVIGTDERFFHEEEQILRDLYNEKSKVLNKEISEDVDLSSYALEIWNKAVKSDPLLEEQIKEMPDSIHASKEFQSEEHRVLLFAKSHITNDLLELDQKGNVVTENQKEILDKACCNPNTPAKKKAGDHYDIVRSGLKTIEKKLQSINKAGSFGTSRNPRYKLYNLFESISDKTEEDKQIIDDIYIYPLFSDIESNVAKRFRRKISDEEIMNYTREKFKEETLVNKKEAKRMSERPRIVCSMGLV